MFDKEGKLVRLSLKGGGWDKYKSGTCGSCKNKVFTDIIDTDFRGM